MSQSVTVAATITKIRQLADLVTADQANSVIPDSEFVSVINDAYRSLYDIIAASAGPEYFATSATVAPSSFTLPSDFYQALGVDIPNYWGTNQALTLSRWNFIERNRRSSAMAVMGYDMPTYRIQNGAIAFEPASAAPTVSVTLWYVPTPAALASNGSFNAVNGWDDYVVAWGVLYAREKQEEPTDDARIKLQLAELRVRNNAGRIVRDPKVVADLRTAPDRYYYNS